MLVLSTCLWSLACLPYPSLVIHLARAPLAGVVYPTKLCRPELLSHTSLAIDVVARSAVAQMVAGSDPNHTPQQTLPPQPPSSALGALVYYAGKLLCMMVETSPCARANRQPLDGKTTFYDVKQPTNKG